jgi:uncharacterized membrane protein
VSERQAASRHTATLNRVEALSDGVFAIAATLLVIELHVPELDRVANGELRDALAEDWPSFAGFALSFATILVMWVNHHGIFTLVHRADGAFLFANGLLLLAVTAVPFPTAVVARYLDTDAGETAVALYAGVFVLIALGYNALWWAAAYQRRLLVAEVGQQQVAGLSRRLAVGPPMYLLALLAALWNAYAGLAILAGLWLFWTITALDARQQLYARGHDGHD